MLLFWGDDLIQFYNDAYRPSLGNEGKHPAALGQRGEECWPEIWTEIHPLIMQVQSTGEATWSEDQLLPIFRNGKLEEVYWTFSYSAALDDMGNQAGVLVTCMETTEKVLNFKQLGDSRNQLEFAIESMELATWDLNPHTKQFLSNDRLKEWFGLPLQTETLLSSALDVIDPEDVQRVKEAIQHALEPSSGGLLDIEYTILNPANDYSRIVRAKGRACFKTQNIPYRFNGTLQDITAHATAHKSAGK